MVKSAVPDTRVKKVGGGSPNDDGGYVLYWMIANRRPGWNYSLDRAVDWAKELGKPLVVFEALRAGYRWASDRIHAFVIQGMLDNADAFEKQPVLYYPYLEPEPDAGKGLLQALAERACVVISDDFPSFFLPRMIQAAARQIAVPLELVDSNGIMPMRDTDRVFARAYDFRRYLQKNIQPHLTQSPRKNALQRVKLPELKQLPQSITDSWPPAELSRFREGVAAGLTDFPVDHSVAVTETSGGVAAGRRALKAFVSKKLEHYAELRNQPQEDVGSGLSPYLHFGHVSAHEVFHAVTNSQPWSVECIADKASGSKQGWWGASEEVESFLDELITWRELGYNMCALTDDYDQYESLPDWARTTLEEHADDQREYTYSLEEFEQAQTHDPLWNAAQTQLVQEGRIHNYLRMLWGKKVLEWTASPQEALEVLIELNNKYALDGRNPNSYSGIFWCLGRYDRAWGPERPIFGKIRYMSSENTARKVKVKNYIDQYSGNALFT